MKALSRMRKLLGAIAKKVKTKAQSLQPKPLLLFDIGSATVGVAIISFPKGEPSEIHFTHRERIVFESEKEDPESLGTAVGAAISKAASRALDALGKLDMHHGEYEARAIIHAPWTDSKSRRAEKNLVNETLITKDFLKKFIVEQLPPEAHENRTQFDRHTIRIELNGYATRNPDQKHAENIAVTVLESSMANEVNDAVMSAFEDALPNHDVHLDAFLFTTTQMRELFGAIDAYTIVDISGKYTSVSVVRDQTVIGTAWAKFGTENLVDTISNGDPDARSSAISELTMFFNDTCTPAQCRKVESRLESVEKDWVRAFGDACTKLSKTHRMPTNTFVSVDTTFGPWFTKGLQRLDFGQFTVTGQPLSPQLITPDTAKKPLMFKSGVKKDSMLALQIAFVDK